jgi:hypothetical protein
MTWISGKSRLTCSMRESLSVTWISGAMLFLVVTAANSVVTSNEQPLTWLKSGNYDAVEPYYAGVQRDYELGKLSDQQLYAAFRKLYEDDISNARYFDQWVRSYPKSYSARVARGAYYYRMAWAARGVAFIAKTPPERLARMENYVNRALPDLQDSLTMTAKPYLSTLYLVNVKMLDGTAQERRGWFDRGTMIDPNNTLLRVRYMVSLQPRWGGSLENMQALLNECEHQHVAAATMAELQLNFASESAAAVAPTATPTEMLARWTEVEQLSETVRHTPFPVALAGYARAAWDLHRRVDADRALAQLAQLDVDDAWTLSQMGWIYVHEHRMAEGWSVLQKAATLNDAWSQFAVGKTLIEGCPEIKLSPDQSAGIGWIRRAAEQGFPEAVAFLKK